MSVKDKYKQSITRRIDRINEKRAKLNDKINRMRARIDSIQTVYNKQGQTVPDSLLSREEQEEWQKMQREQLEKKLEKEQEALRQQMMDSLGIHPTDSTPLTKDQEKAIRKALKEYKEKQEEAEVLRLRQAEETPEQETPAEDNRPEAMTALSPDKRRKV